MATNYYVDTAADAGGDGTTTALTGAHCAFKTLAQAEAASLVGDDQLALRRDRRWREDLVLAWSGSLGHQIKITDYGTGALPKISGADLVATWSNHSGNIWSAACATEPHVVLFDGTVGTHVAAHDNCDGAGDWVWESNVLYVYSTSDPDTAFTAPGIEAGTGRWLITTNYAQRNYITIENINLYGFDGSPALHATHPIGWILSGMEVEKGARTGFHMIGPNGLVIHDCTLTGIRTLTTAWKGIYCYSDATHTTQGVSIYNTDVNYWTGYGIHILGYSYANRATTSLVHDCDLSHNTTGLYLSYCDGGEAYELICDDNLIGGAAGEEYGIAMQTVSNFDLHDFSCTNGRCGVEIWAWVPGTAPFPLSGPSEGNKVHHGKSAGNTEHGVLIYEGCASYTEIYRMLLYNNHLAGASISENSGASISCQIRHCTFYNNNLGNHGYADLYFGSACAGWTFKNNVFYAVTTYAVRSGNATLAAAHAHNLYYRSSGNVIDDHGTYYTMATGPTWETDGSKWADPLFTSLTPGAEDFTPLLSPTPSPCKDAGEDLGDNVDYYGNAVT